MYKSIILSLVLLCGCQKPEDEVYYNLGTVTDVQTLMAAKGHVTKTITVIKTTRGNVATNGVANVTIGEEVEVSRHHVRVGGWIYYRE
jgi:hypothetical protein